MKRSEAFNSLRNQDHSASFNELGAWLDQQPKPRKKMNRIYKVAASITITAMVLIACTLPVETEEEIGFMIRGYAEAEIAQLKTALATIPDISASEFSITPVIFEQEESGESSNSNLMEVVMILPEADYDAAVAKKNAISGAYNFGSVEILPIEETVEKRLYEVALGTFEIRLDSSTPDSVIAFKIEQFLHENSSADGYAEVVVNEQGVRVVEITEEPGTLLEIKEAYSGEISPIIKMNVIGAESEERLDSSAFRVIERSNN
ncbi:MAG: hypothetical protein MI700_08060 [Balneolales bacterium]|nr:hypothetical protein [Balneolales bacterium]